MRINYCESFSFGLEYGNGHFLGDSMFVCICNAVTDQEIRQAVELGACSFAQISDQLGVASCCGKCRKEACQVIKQHKVSLQQLRMTRVVQNTAPLQGAAFA